LTGKLNGLSRNDIAQKSGLTNGGGLTRLLDELEESGFIQKFVPYGKKSRDTFYQLSDYFCLFYLKFMIHGGSKGEDYWLKMQDNPSYRAWSGLAFERICADHILPIKKALGISGVLTKVSSWRSSDKENKAQIDLLIDRNDQVVTICEMKFSVNPYVLSKKEEDLLRKRIAYFQAETNTRKAIFLALITPYGVDNINEHADLVQYQVTAKDLFV
jgi:hypothetical protein